MAVQLLQQRTCAHAAEAHMVENSLVVLAGLVGEKNEGRQKPLAGLPSAVNIPITCNKVLLAQGTGAGRPKLPLLCWPLPFFLLLLT